MRKLVSPDEDENRHSLGLCQGSETLYAIRLFKQFVTLIRMIKQLQLLVGDLGSSTSDSQPTFEQITLARENYGLVRENTENIALITDSISNEGGLLERVADNPEGLVNFYFTNDKNADDLIDSGEYESIKGKINNRFYGDFSEFDISEDSKLDFGELYDLASAITYKGWKIYTKNMCKILVLLKGHNWPKLPKKLALLLKNRACLPRC